VTSTRPRLARTVEQRLVPNRTETPLTATPDVRLEDVDHRPDRACGAVDIGDDASTIPGYKPLRMVTADQVDLAILQLRERRGRPAAEQMHAVLRALDLTVAPRSEHRR
jgi:hypothetical protein